MIRSLTILTLGSLLSVNALAADPGGQSPTPSPAPVTTPSTSTPSSTVHTMGTVTKIDTAAKAITVTGTDGKPVTYTLGSLTLDKSIVVGSKVDIAHAPNSMAATSVTMAK